MKTYPVRPLRRPVNGLTQTQRQAVEALTILALSAVLALMLARCLGLI